MNRFFRQKSFWGITLLAVSLSVGCEPAEKPMTVEEITAEWHAGRTLPLETGKLYPPQLLNLPNDNGYNVLIDIAHQCSFALMWGLNGRFHEDGYRSVSSQASLNSVLDPEGKCRVRIPLDPENKIYPFAWYPNFKYNVVLTEQGDLNAQAYTADERKALAKFVKDGGGLIVLANPAGSKEKAQAWTLDSLLGEFGASMTGETERFENRNYAALNVGEEWDVLASGDKKLPVQARREFGKGRVVVAGAGGAVHFHGDNQEMNKQSADFLKTTLAWLCEAQKPVGGEPRFPQTMGGGGAIYPELEGGTEGMVIFYAQNQKPALLNTVEQKFPIVTEKVQGWLPSRATSEPMYLILSAGDGGGWAVNAFKPKENGIISLSDAGLLSIYAHELAHTMSGPDSDAGKLGGATPFAERGEAHAGWFQGKIDAWFDSTRRERPNRNVLEVFNDKGFMEKDPADWGKTWYIWQKLDDRYGPTWYPRWRWIQHTRWQEDPGHNLTWEEMTEEMSVAVGEDLFPFFRKVGIKLDRPVMGKVSVNGEEYQLKPAPIEATAPGKVNIDDIGDYKKPLTVVSK